MTWYGTELPDSMLYEIYHTILQYLRYSLGMMSSEMQNWHLEILKLWADGMKIRQMSELDKYEINFLIGDC